MRTKWVEARKNDTIKTQLHYAKKALLLKKWSMLQILNI